MRRIHFGIAVVLICVASTPSTAQTGHAQEPAAKAPPDSQAPDRRGPLTNKRVRLMLDSGLSPELTIELITHSECQFDTSPNAIIELKNAGVPESVLRAMIQKRTPAPAPLLCADCAVVVAFATQDRVIGAQGSGQVSESGLIQFRERTIRLTEGMVLLDTGREYVVMRFNANPFAERPSVLGSVVRMRSRPPTMAPGETVKLAITPKAVWVADSSGKKHNATCVYREAKAQDDRSAR